MLIAYFIKTLNILTNLTRLRIRISPCYVTARKWVLIIRSTLNIFGGGTTIGSLF